MVKELLLNLQEYTYIEILLVLFIKLGVVWVLSF